MLRDLFGPAQPETPAAHTDKQHPRRPPGDTILDAQAAIVGTLRAEGNVHLAGLFVGDISTRGAVHVGEQARLEGNLICGAATIVGMVQGNVTARQVMVLRSGRVLGDLRTEKLVTEEGASIQGVVTLEEALDIGAMLSSSELLSAHPSGSPALAVRPGDSSDEPAP